MQKLRRGNWLVACAAMSCVLVSCGVSGSNRSPQPTVTYEDAPEAFDAWREGRFADAAALFRQNARAGTTMRLLAAEALLDAVETRSERDAVYEQARLESLAGDQDPQSHFIMGYIALRTNHLDVAAEENQRSIELLPLGELSGAAFNNLGQVYYLNEQFDSARETTQLATTRAYGLGREIAETNLAEFDALEGNLQAAEERLNAYAHGPAALFELARLHDATGRIDSALMLERRALRLDGVRHIRRNMTFVWPELQLQNDALEAEALGRREEARQTWASLQSRECSGLRWSALKGVAEEHLRRLGADVVPCEAPAPVVAEQPVSAPVIVVATPAMPPVGTTPRTVAARAVPDLPVVAGVTTVPGARVNHKALGFAHLMNEELDDAMKEFQLAVAENTQDSGAHGGVGIVHYLQGSFTDARTELETSLRLAEEPGSVGVLLANLADIDALSGDTHSAELKLKDAVEAAPESPAPYYELAILFDVTGRADGALAMMRRAIELDESGQARETSVFVWPELQLHFEGLLAEAQGDTGDAIASWLDLQSIEDEGALHWPTLHGRASAHLARLQGLARR